MFSLFGGLGQTVFNALDTSHSARAQSAAEKQTLTQWVAKQSWSPFSILTDAQYEDILREKILKIDVELSLLDDRIRQLQTAAGKSDDVDRPS